MQPLPPHHATDANADLFPAKWFKVIVILATIGLAWALWPSRYYFLNDDFIHIPMASDATLGHHNSARHINDLSLFIDHWLFGKWATGYHLTNALLHLANLFLLGWLWQLTSKTLGVFVSRQTIVLMVLGFAVYAFHAETLFWILSRTASLSLLLVLLSWWFIWHAVKHWWLIFPSLVCFWLALFTYETSWLLLPYLLLWWYLANKKMERPIRKRLLVAMAPVVLSWLVYLPLRQHLIQGVLGHYEAGNLLDLNIAALATNAFKLFFRSFLPPFTNAYLFIGLSILTVLVLALLITAIIKRRLVDPLWCWLLACWLLSYALFISLGMSVTGYESDRYLYFSSAFLSAWVVYSCYKLLPYYRRVAAGGVLFFLSYQLLLLQQAANDYQKASDITSTTISTLQQQPIVPKIQLVNLPITFKGIPTFRYGFAEALRWQLDTSRSKAVQVMTAVHASQLPVIKVERRSNEQIGIIYQLDTDR